MGRSPTRHPLIQREDRARIRRSHFLEEVDLQREPHELAPVAEPSLRRRWGSVVVEVGGQRAGFLGGGRDLGLGLGGMQERATMIGGSLTIDTVPGEGTRVRVTVPAFESGNENA